MSVLPDADEINAIKDLVNSPGFVVGFCLVMVGVLVYYVVVPIPQKLDQLIIAVQSDCRKPVGGMISDIRRNDSRSN
jgi:hypothetical protein